MTVPHKPNHRRTYVWPKKGITLREELAREFEYNHIFIPRESPEVRLERLREFRRTEEEGV